MLLTMVPSVASLLNISLSDPGSPSTAMMNVPPFCGWAAAGAVVAESEAPALVGAGAAAGTAVGASGTAVGGVDATGVAGAHAVTRAIVPALRLSRSSPRRVSNRLYADACTGMFIPISHVRVKLRCSHDAVQATAITSGCGTSARDGRPGCRECFRPPC